MKFTSSLLNKIADYDNSTVQITYGSELNEDILNFVNEVEESDLYTEEGENGRETNPHITVLYGIHENNPSKLDLTPVFLPKEVEWEGLDKFARKDNPYDVLIIKIKKTPEMQKLFDYINEVYPDNDNSFPDYTPHTTIAYVKKGEADKYIEEFGDIFIGPHAIQTIQFAFNENKWDYDPLTGEQKWDANEKEVKNTGI